jgi:LPS-assembly protein
MARLVGARPILFDRRAWRSATVVAVALAIGAFGWVDIRPAAAQEFIGFPKRPEAPKAKRGGGLFDAKRTGAQEQMLVRASEINYDHVNQRVSAVGNVQIYHGGSTLEADKVIYDQKAKRLFASGNVRLAEADGRVTYGEIIDLSDDFRDGFVDSLRLDGPEQTRFASRRAERTSGNFTVFQSGVYTACEACKDDPTKPPKWQVKAARIIHDEGEKMIYFEDARLEFFGVPLAYVPFFSAPDPTVQRKTGFLIPTFSSSTVYGTGVEIPYYWALAPDYDLTFNPLLTTKQGALLKSEWRQRLINGSYYIRGAGIFQLDKDYFLNSGNLPGYRDWRGSIETSGQFSLTDKWVWGWDGTLVTDKTFIHDYGVYKNASSSNVFVSTPDYVLSQFYLVGRGDRSYFDARTLHFQGFSAADDQRQIPIVHPVIDHDYTFGQPVLGGELSFRTNLTSLSRESANFDAISVSAILSGVCGTLTPDPARNINNCLLRGVPGSYTRLSHEMNWRRTLIDSYGQVFTPFVSLRGDVAALQVGSDPGVSNYLNTGSDSVTRFMPTVGVEYRYPFISLHSWGTQTIEPIAQLIFRPDETGIGRLPNEDAQSLIFDDGNLFRVNKFSGWDRVEGGGRLNAGVQYTAQFNRGGFVNVLFGQSYHLFGQNSFSVGDVTNTGLNSGLDAPRSDYVARASYQPNSTLMFTSRFRFAENDFTLQRTELETTANFDRWTTSVMYGNYAAQPALGFINAREGVLGSARVKLNPNWLLLGAARYDIRADKVSQTQIGVGYVDDCLIVAMNYITDYAYSGSTSANHTVLLQVSLRTLGGTAVGQNTNAIPGLSSTAR